MNFYNDIDKHAAAWLRELVKQGYLPAGEVSETPIQELDPDELRRYKQVHLFAGVGGWPLALQLAGWDPGRPVWTGSCPCQPFSTAGKRKGQADHRHLWPAMFRLVRECRPDAIFGEQVAGAIAFGWLDDIGSDLESESYALGAAVLGSHSIQGCHKRQRLYWVADRIGQGGTRQVKGRNPCTNGYGRWRGEADLQSIASRPFDAGDGWPKPLLCSLDDGIPGRLDLLRGFGNAIDPRVAAAFVGAFLDTKES
jgi:DNA (cytosine-5)-methyltransferase 1